MKSMARLISPIICCVMLAAAASALANDNAYREEFVDAFCCGEAGGSVGAALLAFAKRPADQPAYMTSGAASGILGASAAGVTTSTRALARADTAGIRFAMPTVLPDLSDTTASRQTSITWRAQLLRGTFW